MNVDFGWGAKPMAEQFKGTGVPAETLDTWQRDSEAITRLAIRGLIPDSAAKTARARMVRVMTKAVSNALDARGDG